MSTAKKEMFPFPIIRKRDGRMTRFDIEKISGAIYKTFYATGIDKPENCSELAAMVVEDLAKSMEGNVPHVEEIQDSVERILIREGYAKQAKAFILYRAKRTNIREGKSELMDSVESILQETRKETPYSSNSTSAKMLKIAAAASRTFYLSRLIPSQFAESHNRGDIHIHDLDYYGKTVNSLQIPIIDLLRSGFYSGYSYIRPPKHISSTGALIAVIIQSCQNDTYGGQSLPSFDKFIGEYWRQIKIDEDETSHKELSQTMQGLIYNLNMLYSRMGAQVPMSTINIGLDITPEGRKIALSLLQAVEDGLGKHETPLFPWIVYHIKDGINYKEGDPNYDIFQKAIQVSCRRMNPSFAFADSPVNFNSEKIAYWGDGSRADSAFLQNSDLKDNNREWGWGNIGQVTINLPRIAFRIAHKRKDFLKESFFSELRRALEVCARQLIHRRDVLSNLHASEIPFVMGEKIYQGAANFSPDAPIRQALEFGIMSIGIVGMAEALYILYGHDHGEDPSCMEFALEVFQFMKEHIKNLSKENSANFVLTASSSGYAAQRFPQLDRIEFGITPKVNDKKYYTQSFSIPATSEIPWEKKLEIEGKFHQIAEGGHFTFLESLAPPSVKLYEKVLKKMKECGIAYGGISFPLTESLENGGIVTDDSSGKGKIRTIRRAAGLLLPFERINSALQQELANRHFDF